MRPASTSNKQTQRSPQAQANAYLASLPEDARTGLERLRRAILAAAPGAQLSFKYGMPGFTLGGRPLVAFAAFKHHLSLFPGAAAIEAHAADLKGYVTSKGTIQFSPARPLPARLVAKLVRARMAALQRDSRPAPRRRGGA